jgi:hypothetical protein
MDLWCSCWMGNFKRYMKRKIYRRGNPPIHSLDTYSVIHLFLFCEICTLSSFSYRRRKNSKFFFVFCEKHNIYRILKTEQLEMILKTFQAWVNKAYLRLTKG